MKQHKKSIREKSIADPINTESIEHYILRPNESFGIFKFGDKISNYLNLKHTIEDIDGYFEDYIFYELGIRIWLAEDSKEKIIESVVSSSFCIINNYNIIGMSYGQFVKLYDFICEGEDTIYLSCDSGVAINKEIFDQLGRKCPISGSDKFIEKRAIEVGNIFKLGTRFTDAYGYTTLDENGNSKPIYMASYGIGLTRLIGTVAETLSDESGLKWPSSIAPFSVNLISLAKNETDVIATEHIFHLLDKIGIEVLYDDRQKVSAGEKFVESDLLGLPYRIVASSKLLAKNELELQRRGEEKKMVAPIEQIINFLSVNK